MVVIDRIEDERELGILSRKVAFALNILWGIEIEEFWNL